MNIGSKITLRRLPLIGTKIIRLKPATIPTVATMMVRRMEIRRRIRLRSRKGLGTNLEHEMVVTVGFTGGWFRSKPQGPLVRSPVEADKIATPAY